MTSTSELLVLRRHLAFLCLLCLSGAVPGFAATSAQRHFDLPADSAEKSLKRLSEQSGREVLFPADAVEGVQTRAVKGEMAPQAALDAMLIGTVLVGVQDAKTGSLTVRREKPASNAEKKRLARGADDAEPPAAKANSAEAGSAMTAAAGHEMLSGTVINAATGRVLEGARVAIQGAGREILTDEQGIYRLVDLPVGPQILSVSYTGLDSQLIPVTIEARRITRLDVGLTSGIYTLGAFVVSGEREGNARAITLQRQSSGVKNIVSADAFGNLAGNPADLLQLLPGVVGESSGGDMRFVQIRGMSQQLNSITMDGNRMADAGSAGSNREYQFQQIGSDTIERMEVVKSPTPDMDADSIGGAVNMVSKSAFDRSPRRRLGGSVGVIWRAFDERDEPRRNYSISYSEVFGGKFGVSFNYARRAHLSSIDLTTQAHQPVVNVPAYTYQFQFQDWRNLRTRWGGGLKLDYKLSDNTRFYLNSTLNRHDEHANTNSATFTTGQTIATVDANGNLTGTGAIVPGFTKDRTEWRPVNNSTVALSAQSTHKIGDSLHLQMGAVHRYRNLDIDYNIYQSRSLSEYPNNGNFDITARGIGLRLERTNEPFFPYITQTAGPDITKISSYGTGVLAIQRTKGVDKYRGAALNVKKAANGIVPTYVKAGLRIRNQTRDLRVKPDRENYVGADGVAGVNPATGINDDNLAQFANPSVESPLRHGRYPVLPFTGRPFRDTPGTAYDYAGFNATTLLRDHPEYFREDIAGNISQNLLGDQHFKENVSAAYVMGNVVLGKLAILGGVRVEDTQTEAEGALQEITPAEKARRAAWVGAVTDAELRRRTIAEYSGRRKAEGDYRGVFPGIHFKVEPMRGLIGRASYATNIGRPGIGQLIPRTNVNYDARTVSTNNPGLEPQYANNFDLGLEYYFEPIGLVSAGVFLKEIHQFIFNAGGQTVGAGADNGFDGDYAGFTLTTQRNGGFAKIKGFELAYQQQFTFLPGWWKGFGVFANYTRMETEGNYGTATVSSTSQVAGFIPESGNVGISYIKNKVSLRVQFNYVGRFLNSFNANQALLLYRTARSTLNIKTVYQLSSHFDFYLDVVNATGQSDRTTEFFGGRPQTIYKLSPQFLIGFNGRL